MHVEHNQRSHECTLQCIELAPDDRYLLIDQLFHEIEVLHETSATTLAHCDDGLGTSLCPLDKIDCQHRLCEVDEEPIVSFNTVTRVVMVRLLADIVEGSHHHVLDLE